MVVGEFTQEAELVIIGAGPGGYAAAFRAAELGVQVAVVDERDAWGGVCLHAGCIPSKTLLHLAEIAGLADTAPLFGIKYSRPDLDVGKMRDWVKLSVDRLAAGLAGRAKKLGVELIKGRAHFEDEKHLAVVGGSVPRIKFRRAIVATGSVPKAHIRLPFDSDHVWSPRESMELPEIPERLLVVGSGYMAAELATIYAGLGSHVTMASDQPQLLPSADPDLQRPLLKKIEKLFAATLLEASVEAVDETSGGLKVTLRSAGADAVAEFDRAIVCLGQQPNLDDLNIDVLRLSQKGEGFLSVDEQMHTNHPRIFAVGDVTGHPLLADRALRQGRVAAEVIAGWNSAMDARAIPVTVFTDPQLAWCGLTEAEAQASSHNYRVQKVPWGASGRAVGMARTDGLTKLIYEPDTKLILGIGMVGAGAAEMISEAALAIEMGAELTDLAETIHPHPTMSELLSTAAETAASAE